MCYNLEKELGCRGDMTYNRQKQSQDSFYSHFVTRKNETVHREHFEGSISKTDLADHFFD